MQDVLDNLSNLGVAPAMDRFTFATLPSNPVNLRLCLITDGTVAPASQVAGTAVTVGGGSQLQPVVFLNGAWFSA